MRSADTVQKRRNTGNALILVTKSPVVGRVKTRLASPGVPEECVVKLASAFLEDTCALLKHPLLPARVVLALDGDPADLPASASLLLTVAQGNGDLGQRLTRLFAAQFAIPGTRAVCAIGSDTPHLPLAFVVEAFSRLASPDTDVVWGPADDGGYYLVGMNRLIPELFQNIPWSSPDVLTASRERARALGVRAALLPPWYDIDTPSDLTKLRDDISRKTVTAMGTDAVLRL
ncbi:MAG: TIGR04282 family arsenosugar biosynthesis glycosyltransferase [Fibrella sp.]|nr:TIGR04282 family arsenosugar biosynthesis glycosyltransferase [Armatimonadota bacterium]